MVVPDIGMLKQARLRNMTNLESGAVKSETTNTYKVTDKEGVNHTETVVKDKVTGEVKREVDGKAYPLQSETPNVEGKKPVLVEYNTGNGGFLQVKLSEMILNQLKEMNFYMQEIMKSLNEMKK